MALLFIFVFLSSLLVAALLECHRTIGGRILGIADR